MSCGRHVRHATSDGKECAAPATARPYLVVDDEHPVRMVVSRQLMDAGFSVILARNGPEALEMLGGTSVPVQVLLTDLRMPVLDGARLAGEVQRMLPDTRILLMGRLSLGRPPNLARPRQALQAR